MIDLEGYITSTLAGARPKVDWNEPPWAGAQAALHWLGVAPAPTGGTYEPLSSADAERLSDRMLRTFVDAGQGLAWSSARLETAAGTIAAAVQDHRSRFCAAHGGYSAGLRWIGGAMSSVARSGARSSPTIAPLRIGT
jgi:hypothetical protein